VQEHLDERVAFRQEVEVLGAQPAADQRVDHPRQHDGEPAGRGRAERACAGAATEHRLEHAQVLLVLVVDALAEALAHREFVARPARQIQPQHVGVLQ